MIIDLKSISKALKNKRFVLRSWPQFDMQCQIQRIYELKFIYNLHTLLLDYIIYYQFTKKEKTCRTKDLLNNL